MLFRQDGRPIKASYVHYYNVGLSALLNIEEALEAADKKFANIERCLDLPCGYGRVLRLLCTRINPQIITACDTNEEAVKFCGDEFGVEPLLSNVDFRQIDFKRKYDLIWVGSLFTHLNQQSFSTLLEVLVSVLDRGGVLVFTAHGEYSLELIDKNVYGIQFPEKKELTQILRNNGFYYVAYPHSKEYGISISPASYTFPEINRLFGNNIKLLMYKYRGWDRHQDVYAYQLK